jgi:FkbM family methyltransferase
MKSIKRSILFFRTLSLVKFDQLIKDTLKILLDSQNFGYIDLGATGGIEPRWQPTIDYLNYVGFEPDGRGMNSAKDIAFKDHLILDKVISNMVGKVQLKITQDVGKTSILQPNTEFLTRFPNSHRFSVKEFLELDSTTLDSIQIPHIDFIKMDIQGAELLALKGATESLKKALGVELEVSFAEIYCGQPLFGVINEHMVAAGFEFIDFVNLRRWEREHLRDLGQCTFGDALYLRTPESVKGNLNHSDKYRQYIAILLLYKRFDLIWEYLEKNTQDLEQIPQAIKMIVRIERKFLLRVKIHYLLDKCLTFLDRNFRSHLIY